MPWAGALPAPAIAQTAPADQARVTVDLVAQPFTPRGDRRTLGTMVQRVAIDQSGAWPAFTRLRRALFAIIAAALVALGCVVADVRARRLLGGVLVIAGAVQVLAAGWVAVALLRLGPISPIFYWGALIALICCAICGGALVLYGCPPRALRWLIERRARVQRAVVRRWHAAPRIETLWRTAGAWSLAHRAGIALGALVVACTLLLWFPARLASDLPVQPDAIEYATSAAHLARGAGFTVLLHGVAYPPRYPIGFPALLTPFYALLGPFPGNGIWAVTLCAVGAAIATYVIARIFVGPLVAVVAGGVFLSSPVYLEWSHQVMSDFLSVLLATLLTLLLIGIVRRRIFRWQFALGLAIVAAGMMLTRLIDALIVLVAIAVLLFAARRYRVSYGYVVAGVGVFLLSIGATLVYNHARFGGWTTSGYAYWDPRYYRHVHDTFALSYAHSLSNIQPKHVSAPNAVAYARSLLGFGTLTSLPVTALAAFGAVCLVVRRATLAPAQKVGALFLGLSALAYLGTYTLYYFQSERFLVTLLPALGVFAAFGVRTVLGAAGDQPLRWARTERARRWATLATIAVVFLAGMFAFHSVVRQSYLYTDRVRGIHPLYRRGYETDTAIAPLCTPRCIIVTDAPMTYVEYVVPQAFAMEPGGSSYARTLRGTTVNNLTDDDKLRMITEALAAQTPVFYDATVAPANAHFSRSMEALGQPRLVRDGGYYTIYQLMPRGR